MKNLFSMLCLLGSGLLFSYSSCSKTRTIDLCQEDFEYTTQNWITQKIENQTVEYVFELDMPSPHFVIYDVIGYYEMYDCQGNLMYSSNDPLEKEKIEALEQAHKQFEIYPNIAYYAKK